MSVVMHLDTGVMIAIVSLCASFVISIVSLVRANIQSAKRQGRA